MKTALKIKFGFFIFLLGLIPGSCKNKSEILSTEFKQFGDSGLYPDYPYVFNTGADSLAATNTNAEAWIMIRFSDRCRVNNLPLEIEASSPIMDSVINKSVSIELFDKSGKNKNRDGYGVYEKEILLLDNIDINPGSYLSIMTPDSSTNGILSIGLIIKNKHHRNGTNNHRS